MNLDDYENHRPPRRIRNKMVLPRAVRHKMLRREWDASNQEIAESVRRNVKIKNQRKTTINNLDKATKLEEALESARRKLRRFVTGEKSIKKQVKDLEKQIDLTNRRRSKLIYLEQLMSQNTNRESSANTAPTEYGVSDDSNDTTNDPAVHLPRLQEGFSSNGNSS
jgi:septal ring factor EnvC (AmiA/AmiB activator)